MEAISNELERDSLDLDPDLMDLMERGEHFSEGGIDLFLPGFPETPIPLALQERE